LSASRRNFLVAALGAGGAAALGQVTTGWGWLWPGSGATGDNSAETLTRQTFVPLIGATFTLRPASGGAVSAKLDRVDARPNPPRTSGEAFSLLFTRPRQNRLAQGTYTVEHPSIGSIPLFVVPVGRAEKAHDYEVVINHWNVKAPK